MDTDNLELKKRSRRRLVGAAALALLAAILLPMVMDQEPRSSGQDVQITIPDRDTELARPIAGRAPLNPEPDLAPPPQEQPPAGVAAPVPPVAAPVRPAEPVRPPEPSGEPQTAAAPAPPPAVASAQPPPDEAARVRAILEGKAPPPQATTGSGFVLQVGAFGEGSKAEALANELKSKGLNAYTEKAGSVTRVRVGPYASRGEADRVAERLKAMGKSPVVTAR